MDLFRIKRTPLTEDERERLEVEHALRDAVEACQSRFVSIQLLGGSAERDALVLCRELHQDLVAALSRIESIRVGGAAGNRDRSALSNQDLETRLQRVQDLLQEDDAAPTSVTELLKELERAIGELASAFRAVKREYLWTGKDTDRRRIRVQAIGIALLGAIVAFGGYALKKSWDKEKLAQGTAFYEEAVKLTFANEHANAVERYSQALEVWQGTGSPQLADAYNNLGWSLSQLGRLDEALEAYDMALQLRPDYPLALNNLKATRRELDKQEQ